MDESYKDGGEQPTLKFINLFRPGDGDRTFKLENGPLGTEWHFGKDKKEGIFYEQFHEIYDFTIGYHKDESLKAKGFWYIKNN